jgi:hypothetical protein
MVLIEVQTGSYLGEDDIVRYEDLYARMSNDDTDAPLAQDENLRSIIGDLLQVFAIVVLANVRLD